MTYEVNELTSEYSKEYGGGQVTVVEESDADTSFLQGYALPGYLGKTSSSVYVEGYEAQVYVKNPYEKETGYALNGLADLGNCSYICKNCTTDVEEN